MDSDENCGVFSSSDNYFSETSDIEEHDSDHGYACGIEPYSYEPRAKDNPEKELTVTVDAIVIRLPCISTE